MSSEPSESERAERILQPLAAAVALGLIAIVGIRWYAYQWDLHMFMGAARDFAAGTSPYRGQGLSYYHPPLLLYVYRLFTFFPVWLACSIWYALKLGSLWALLSIWNKEFVRIRYNSATIAFLILGFNACIYSDLVAGNVSIFEELLLWLAFANLLKSRYWAFSLCLVLASQIKLTPLFFAVLLVTAIEKPQWRWLFATVAGFAALFSCNQWLQPDLFRQFWKVSSQLDERGVDSSSLLAFTRDAFERVHVVTQQSKLDELVYLLGVAAIGAISLWLLVQYRKSVKKLDERLLIGFACLIFALISPRFKAYTYILLLAPTLYLLKISDWRKQVPVFAAVLIGLALFPHAHSLLPTRMAFELFASYMPLFAAGVVWGGYANVLYRAVALERAGAHQPRARLADADQGAA
jgi:hypothetical protein